MECVWSECENKIKAKAHLKVNENCYQMIPDVEKMLRHSSRTFPSIKIFDLIKQRLFIPSGFLLSYMFYEKQKKKPSEQLAIDVVKGIVYRYIRIAPCFMIVSHTKNYPMLTE